MLGEHVDLLASPALWDVCRLTLGSALLVSGLAKLASPLRFVRAVRGFGVLPSPMANLYGALVPAVEVAAGALLVARQHVHWAGTAALVLLATFAAATLLVLIRDAQVECGCFGPWGRELVSVGTLVRQGRLAAIAAVVVFRPGLPVTPWGQLTYLVEEFLPAALFVAGMWVISRLAQDAVPIFARSRLPFVVDTWLEVARRRDRLTGPSPANRSLIVE